ncbi:hypothetical protein HanIR_Chr10g0478851 [Helianthus annuus]|nr:hypothetical protein HanIR_Chr10g0478851 [Helianthus annuus]
MAYHSAGMMTSGTTFHALWVIIGTKGGEARRFNLWCKRFTSRRHPSSPTVRWLIRSTNASSTPVISSIASLKA